MLSLLIIPILTLPFFVNFVMDKNKILPVFVFFILSLFLGINIANAFILNTKVIAAICIISFVSLIAFLSFKAFKEQKFNLENLKSTLIELIPLYVFFGAVIFIRMWFTRINTDALYYADISQQIKSGEYHNVDYVYKLPSFYSIAALMPRSIDVYSIFGDILMIMIFSVVAIKFIDGLEFDKFWVKIVSTILLMALCSVSFMFKTSSLNWNSVSLIFIIMIVERKNSFLLLSLPIAFTFFSFSAMLTAPVALVFLILSKQKTLKEIYQYLIFASITFILYISSSLSLDPKIFIVIVLLFTSLLIMFWSKFPNKIIENPLYKINLMKNIEITKRFKAISATIIFTISITLLVILTVFYYNPETVDVFFRESQNWLFIILPFVLLSALWTKTFTSWLKFIIAIIITFAFMAIARSISDKVPFYVFRRFMAPLASMTPLLLLLFTLDQLTKFKLNKKILLGTPLLFTAPISTIIVLATPAYFWLNLSTDIESNYKWIKDNEWETLSKYNDKKVYSDVPAFIMEGNKHNYMKVNQHRWLFHGDLYQTMIGRNHFVRNNLENINVNFDDMGAYKWTMEYARITGDWSKVELADIYIFRHKYYADKIVKHFHKTDKDIIMENGMYIFKK